MTQKRWDGKFLHNYLEGVNWFEFASSQTIESLFPLMAMADDENLNYIIYNAASISADGEKVDTHLSLM